MYKTTVKIDGMMCGHCEAQVNDAIRSAFEVDAVHSSHEAGETYIVSPEALDEDAVRAALAETDFTVLGVESEPHEKKGLFGGKFSDTGQSSSSAATLGGGAR